MYENRRRFGINDASGRPLVEAIPVFGGEGAGAFSREFSEVIDSSAFSIGVTRPNGETLFFLERAEGDPIVFVTDTGHRMIGRVTGTSGEVRGSRIRPRDCLVDVNERPLATVVWESQQRRGDPTRLHCDFISLDGRRIGRFERGILRLDFRFSRQLHTLLIAAPILFHLKSGG